VLTKYLLEELKEREQLEDSGVDSRIILNYILRKRSVEVWTRIIVLRWAPLVEFCQQGNEPPTYKRA
jgi:hypothetical protein